MSQTMSGRVAGKRAVVTGAAMGLGQASAIALAAEGADLVLFDRDAAGLAEYHYVLVDYLCRVTGGELRAGDDVSSARWVERCCLGQYRITEATLPVIEKAFGC